MFETFETLSHDDKSLAKKVFDSHFGSLEAIEDMEWCVFCLSEGDSLVYKSVRDFVEALVRESEIG